MLLGELLAVLAELGALGGRRVAVAGGLRQLRESICVKLSALGVIGVVSVELGDLGIQRAQGGEHLVGGVSRGVCGSCARTDGGVHMSTQASDVLPRCIRKFTAVRCSLVEALPHPVLQLLDQIGGLGGVTLLGHNERRGFCDTWQKGERRSGTLANGDICIAERGVDHGFESKRRLRDREHRSVNVPMNASDIAPSSRCEFAAMRSGFIEALPNTIMQLLDRIGGFQLLGCCRKSIALL